MDELYDTMRDALRLFGLHFSEMYLVEVTVEGGAITFTHDNVRLTYTKFSKGEK